MFIKNSFSRQEAVSWIELQASLLVYKVNSQPAETTQ